MLARREERRQRSVVCLPCNACEPTVHVFVLQQYEDVCDLRLNAGAYKHQHTDTSTRINKMCGV